MESQKKEDTSSWQYDLYAADLCNDLHAIGDKTQIFDVGGITISVADLIQVIEEGSPVGRQLYDLDEVLVRDALKKLKQREKTRETIWHRTGHLISRILSPHRETGK